MMTARWIYCVKRSVGQPAVSLFTTANVCSTSSQCDLFSADEFFLNETDLPEVVDELVKQQIADHLLAHQEAIQKDIDQEVERHIRSAMAPSKAVTNQQILNAIGEQSAAIKQLLEVQTEILSDQKRLLDENAALRKENEELKARLVRLEQPEEPLVGFVPSEETKSRPEPSAPFASPFAHFVPSVPTLPPPLMPQPAAFTRPVGHPNFGPPPRIMRNFARPPYGSPLPKLANIANIPPMPVLVSRILEEQKERERKSRNVAVIGMDDSGEDSLGTAASPNLDYTAICGCLEELGIDAAKLVSVTRIGDRMKARNGKRLLMAVLADIDAKEAFVGSFQGLSKAVRHSAAYVREDMTPLQRQERARNDPLPVQLPPGRIRRMPEN